MRRHTVSSIAVVLTLSTAFGLVAAIPALAAAPKIKSFAPISGPSGTSVTILGANLTGATSVTFNGAVAIYTVNSASKITAAVPAAATTGPIAVDTPGGTAISAGNFTVVPPDPAVSLSKPTGPPKTSLTVGGTHFGPNEGVDVFFDTTDLALVGTNGAGSFSGAQIKVPASAEPGTHWVSALGRRSGLFAQATFTVRTDWTQFLFSSKHSGKNPTENMLSSETVRGLDLAWTYTTVAPSHSSAAVANGVAYVGTIDGWVHAVDASTGAYAWSTHTGSFIDRSSPAVANGVVYVGSDGTVYALDAATGALVWSYTTGGFVESSPAVVNGVAYVGSSDGNVYALNAATGALLWSHHTNGGIVSSPAVANGVVYVGSDDRNVYALSAVGGMLQWSYPTSDSVFSSPAVAKGVVYVGSTDGKVYALKAANGGLLWSQTILDYEDASPAVANGAVYVGTLDGLLCALDAATGALLWSYPTDNAIVSSPAIANGVVYVGSFDQKVHAVDAATGSSLWSYPTGGAVQFSPVVVNGTVYASSYDGRFYAFGLDDSAKVRRPAVADLNPDRSLKLRS